MRRLFLVSQKGHQYITIVERLGFLSRKAAPCVNADALCWSTGWPFYCGVHLSPMWRTNIPAVLNAKTTDHRVRIDAITKQWCRSDFLLYWSNIWWASNFSEEGTRFMWPYNTRHPAIVNTYWRLSPILFYQSKRWWFELPNELGKTDKNNTSDAYSILCWSLYRCTMP